MAANKIFLMLKEPYKWLWSPSIWLPPGYNWNSFESTESLRYPNPEDLWSLAFIMTLTILVIRYVTSEFLFKKLAGYFGIKDADISKYKNEELNLVYYIHGINPSNSILKKSAQKLNWTERQVEIWLRKRHKVANSKKVMKFCDSMWQLSYYSFYTCMGLIILWNRSWLWNIYDCFIDYPKHHLDETIRWFYIISLGFYYSSIISICIQPKRKDSFLLLLHHVVTIILIIISWEVNLIRIGTLILLVHECGDIPLHIAKIASYCKNNCLTNFFFLVFILLWFITRLGLYPFWILKEGYFHGLEKANLPSYPVHHIFTSLGTLLLVFHIIWTIFILKVVVRKINNIDIRDSRSDTESEDEEDEKLKKL